MHYQDHFVRLKYLFFFQLIVTVLVCLAAVMGQKLMKNFMQSFADKVLKSTRKQQAVSEKILTVTISWKNTSL